jgi:hypothetical protein
MRQGYRIIGLSILMWSTAGLVSGGEIKNTSKTWDDYKVIAEKNIFSRNRIKDVPVSEVQQPVVVIPEQTYYTLRGITRQSDGYISFIEDERTMAVTKVRKGEKIGGGKVSNIGLDDISFEYGGRTVKVEIGMNLERQKSGSGVQYYPSRTNASKGTPQISTIDQTRQTMGQPPGMGQGTNTGQPQAAGQPPGMDQSLGEGQTQAAGRSSAVVQSQPASQSPAMGQARSTGQPGTSDQTQSATKTVNETGQGNQSSDVLQRLKERRKKELGE